MLCWPRLGSVVKPPGEVDSGSVRLEPGLYEDPVLPRKHGMQELVLGGGCSSTPTQLALARSSARSQTALARLLLDIFFSARTGAEQPVRENGLHRLNPPVVNAIVAYAVGQSQFQPSSAAVIKNSLRNKLGCLRAPSRQQGRPAPESPVPPAGGAPESRGWGAVPLGLRFHLILFSNHQTQYRSFFDTSESLALYLAHDSAALSTGP
ncbi:uncharacterized protein LOC119842665 [Dermochelys coriacea]|uniref:uncharacterized protein LOC119842665 n=1 Tax=Dermochelys coriacea TaxID=27794 RepID=UPI0018E7561D|nr:uncharacterized protein LOC119842665 [Dermochelys coriacea]